MNYQEHDSGLTMAMLTADEKAVGACRYVIANRLWDWQEAVEVLRQDTVCVLAYWEAMRAIEGEAFYEERAGYLALQVKELMEMLS